MRTPPLQPALHLRSYRGSSAPHDHDFPQLVLPVAGALDLDFGSRAGALSAAQGAFVPPRQ
ncbi:MAG: AraC family transcriptional regulator, partial [Comamonadaceae bacterium]